MGQKACLPDLRWRAAGASNSNGGRRTPRASCRVPRALAALDFPPCHRDGRRAVRQPVSCAASPHRRVAWPLPYHAMPLNQRQYSRWRTRNAMVAMTYPCSLREWLQVWAPSPRTYMRTRRSTGRPRGLQCRRVAAHACVIPALASALKHRRERALLARKEDQDQPTAIDSSDKRPAQWIFHSDHRADVFASTSTLHAALRLLAT